jgi:ATP-dependent Zn protease
MGAAENKSQGSKTGPGNQLPKSIWLWCLIFAGLAVWNVLALWPRGPELATIPYSTSLAQVVDGNVSRVHIVGASITGDFVKPFLWALQRKQTSGPKAKVRASELPKTEADARALPSTSVETITPLRYLHFRTTFPEAVGDPGLLHLLEAHKVVVDVSPASAPWFLDLLLEWSPMLLLIGFFWWMAWRSSKAQSGMFGIGRNENAPLRQQAAQGHL